MQVLGRLGWRTNHSLRTDASGNAQTRMRLTVNRSVRALYAGDPGLLPSNSSVLKLGVRPVVSAQVASSGGQRVLVTGRVQPRKPTAVLTLKRRATSGRLVRVSRRTVRLRRGRLLTYLRIKRPAAYRLRLSVLRDQHNLSARSQVAEFRVGK